MTGCWQDERDIASERAAAGRLMLDELIYIYPFSLGGGARQWEGVLRSDLPTIHEW